MKHTNAVRFGRTLLVAVVVIAAIALIGCQRDGEGGGGDTEVVTLEYMLWDANQQPAYEQVAARFTELHPGIEISIVQLGWNDYWTDISRRMVGGDAPDVFTNHLAFANDFARRNQIIDIQPLVEADDVNVDQYFEGLADLWTRDGRRWGLPKDWDTIAVVINEDLFRAAGVDPDALDSWTWNPDDGGTFAEVLRQVGDAGDHFGFGTLYSSPFGQQEWSNLAHSTGWVYSPGPYSNQFNYDQDGLHQTMDWYVRMIDQGVFAPLEDVSSIGDATLFTSGRIAGTFAGSWMIGHYVNNAEFPIRFVPLPIGPVGRRSAFNGLADSIWVGTEHPGEAWEWVKFLASEEAQAIVGQAGVVFPAVRGTEQLAFQAHADRGVDVSAYTMLVEDPETTFLFPLTDNAPEVMDVFEDALEAVFLQDAPSSQPLTAANQRVNELLQN